MKLDRCEKGHFYDISKVKKCPYCEMKKNNEINFEDSEIEIETIAYIPLKIDPVVGWLVCIEGFEKGKDYRLTNKRNFVGSSTDLDVCILGDKKIEKKNNFVITYNEKQKVFVISPGETGNLVYVNKKAIYETAKLDSYSLIEIGDTKLVFVNFCGDNFTWQV